MSLLEQLRQNEGNERASAIIEYRAILARRANPAKDDADRLRALMKILDITAADVAADGRALNFAARCEAEIVPFDEMEKLRETAAGAAEWALGQVRDIGHEILDSIEDDRLARIVAELLIPASSEYEKFRVQARLVLARKAQAAMDLSAAQTRSGEARRRLDEVRRSRPLAFDD